jgi:hypothetical protein
VPNLTDPFDVSLFRTVKDDGSFVMSGKELTEEDVKKDKSFSRFTRGKTPSLNERAALWKVSK